MNHTSAPLTLEEISEVKNRLRKDWSLLRHADTVVFSLFVVGILALSLGYAKGVVPVAWSGAVMVVIAFALTPLIAVYEKHAKLAYASLFDRYEFFTPAGEEVRFISSNVSGTHVEVRFGDGSELRYPLRCLSTRTGQVHQSEECKVPSHQYTLNMSRIKWQTLDGKVGIVRKAERYNHKEDELILKLDDGQIAAFPLSALVPVSMLSAISFD